MPAKFQLPEKKSVIFWPVGTGDSTTIVIKPGELVMQLDLHHLEKSSDPEEPEWPVLDHLAETLPKKNGKPYLAVFALTHPDQDHIRGFAELLKKVEIGELWHTPKIFRDQADEESMCDDAKAFRKEAHRRREAISKSPTSISSGNRLRIIGHDDILSEEKYKKLPESCKSRAGDKVWHVDGNNVAEHFHVFIHAPFKDDQAKDKNNTSLSLNIILQEGKKTTQFFFFGDREYPTIKRVFKQTALSKDTENDNTPYLRWDVMLCSHHCSKAVMHWKDEGDEEEVFKKDIMDYIENYSIDGNGYIISSSHSDFTDGDGDNPPHKKARNRYSQVVKSGRFICTHEYPSKKNPAPVIFCVDQNGLTFDDLRSKTQDVAGLSTGVALARGGSKPPSTQVGFGNAK